MESGRGTRGKWVKVGPGEEGGSGAAHLNQGISGSSFSNSSLSQMEPVFMFP